MGKNGAEGDRSKISALAGYLPASLRNRTARGESQNPVRNKVLAAVVATGAFVAVGSPIVANAGDEAPESSKTVTPMAQQQPLSAAVNGTPQAPASVELRGAKSPDQGAAAPQKLEKSKAVADEKAAAEAERKAAERKEAQRKAIAEQIKMKKAFAEKAAAQAKKAKAEPKKAAQGAAAPAAKAADSNGKAKFVDGRLTSGYHSRGGSHAGIDIGADMGTPIYAPAGGKVISSGPASGFGKWVRVEHGGGMVTVYGHIQSSAVNVGDVVHKGDKIATVGSRGQSTGPHLHFEVRHGAGGTETNPIPWLKDKGITVE